ncbi:hypothetical protein KAJ27_04115, partial [bacterium]|nr:hypothetical protein [bacterium]
MKRNVILFLLLLLFNQAIWSADIEAQLDSNDGSSSFVVQDSGANPVLSIDSDGNVRLNLSSWIGFSGGGIIEFIDAATDTINFLNSFIGIGLSNPNERLTVDGVLSLKEQGVAPAQTVDFGKIYVKSSDNKLYFLNDLGVEHDLTDSGGAVNNLDDAYNGGSSITVDSGSIQLNGTNAADETLEIINTGNGGGMLLENSGNGLTLRINDSAGDATPFVIDADGNLGLGTTNPDEKLHVTGVIQTGIDGTTGSLKLYSEQGGADYSVTINPNNAMTENVTLNLPPANGTANQVLKSDGAGNLLWAADSGGTTYTADGIGIELSGSQFQLELDGAT